jgi:hypothetical protein
LGLVFHKIFFGSVCSGLQRFGLLNSVGELAPQFGGFVNIAFGDYIFVSTGYVNVVAVSRIVGVNISIAVIECCQRCWDFI